ncbi:hypothetical protein HDU96_004809, partial [Phlyctochytrium bullatum]
MSDLVDGALILHKKSGMPMFTGKGSWTMFKSNIEISFDSKGWKRFLDSADTTKQTAAEKDKDFVVEDEHKKARFELWTHIHPTKQSAFEGKSVYEIWGKLKAANEDSNWVRILEWKARLRNLVLDDLSGFESFLTELRLCVNELHQLHVTKTQPHTSFDDIFVATELIGRLQHISSLAVTLKIFATKKEVVSSDDIISAIRSCISAEDQAHKAQLARDERSKTTGNPSEKTLPS